MRDFLIFICTLFSFSAFAQTPEITSWLINTDGSTGYGNIATNVQSVYYTNTDVYVTATCIPGYDIGPWAGNPNTPANQNFCFKITRSPQENTGTKTATGLGHIGVWTNGVSIFNAKDAFSYNNQGIWNQDALPNEGASFDICLGHPAPNGEYHHHVNPTCLYDDQDDATHSPIIGYAFDGFPVYGAYGFANSNGTGGVIRMKTSYRLRSIAQRTSLPDGTQLQAGQYGPAINAQNPLGKYIEDYEYVQGLGELDEYNGRFSVTPDYPNGIYAYFVSVDSNFTPAYPYTVGTYYYGTVQQGNTGPQSGHNTIPGGATQYTPVTTSIKENTSSINISVSPNPTSEKFKIDFENTIPLSVQVFDVNGKIIYTQSQFYTSQAFIDASWWNSGVYFISCRFADGSKSKTKVFKQ
jgi:hypothetical protein